MFEQDIKECVTNVVMADPVPGFRAAGEVVTMAVIGLAAIRAWGADKVSW